MKNNPLNIIAKWVNLLQGIAVIVGVFFAIWQIHELVVQNTIQDETLEQTHLADSANLMLNLDDKLNSSQYIAISTAIQNYPSTSPVLDKKDGGRGGAFDYNTVEDYLGNYEDIGILVENNVLLANMTYDDFSYAFEKTWCNDDVRTIVTQDRKASGDFTSPTRFWANFETLAKSFLIEDNTTCAGMDKE